MSTGMLFQIKAPEYDKLFLNMFNLGFDVLNFFVRIGAQSHRIIFNTTFDLEHFSNVNRLPKTLL